MEEATPAWFLWVAAWPCHTLSLCYVARRTPDVPPKSQLHVVSNQEDVVQSLEFNPASHSQPALLSTPREEDHMWRLLRGPMAAEHMLEGGWLPEGWSEVQSPHWSHSEMTPASDRYRPQP